jgi:hypothetical protein
VKTLCADASVDFVDVKVGHCQALNLENEKPSLTKVGEGFFTPTGQFSNAFSAACRAAAVRGNLAFHAQIAAVCREHGVDQLPTANRDFARFKELHVVPLAKSPP